MGSENRYIQKRDPMGSENRYIQNGITWDCHELIGPAVAGALSFTMESLGVHVADRGEAVQLRARLY